MEEETTYKVKEDCYCILIPFSTLEGFRLALQDLGWACKVLKLKDKDYNRIVDRFMIQVQGGKS